MSNTFYKPLISLGGLLYPLYTLPWIVKSMIKNEYFGYILFSFTMAYLAYLMVPYDTMDITRHYARFDLLSDESFNNISEYGVFSFLLNVYMWCISKIGLPKEFIPFSLVFITYLLYFISLKKIIQDQMIFESKQTIKYILLVTIGVFLLVNEIRFVGTASGLRNGLAFSVFIFGLMKYYIERRTFFFLFLSLLAILIHISVLPLAIIFLFANFVQMKRLSRILFMVSLLLLITGMASTIFYAIIGILEPFLRSSGLYFPSYMSPDGAWGSSFYADKNIKTIILEKFIKPFPFYLSGLYLLFVRDIHWKNIQNYLYFLFVFIALISVSRTMLDRYAYFFTLLFIFVLIVELKSKPLSKFKKIFIAMLIGAMILMDFGGMVKYRAIFVKSWIQILYIPAPFMFLHSISKNNYIKRESL